MISVALDSWACSREPVIVGSMLCVSSFVPPGALGHGKVRMSGLAQAVRTRGCDSISVDGITLAEAGLWEVLASSPISEL